MAKSSFPLSVLILGLAVFASGCDGTQKSQASAGCKANYVGREKAACDMGVNLADKVAKKADGKSYKKKYASALGECHRLEKPLVSCCVSGVNKYRAELAKLDPAADRQIASTKAVKKNRAPASSN
ncbi:MAG: hypothetical protein HY074_20555 [Deltaproteobacteria bacterium]|nr:hypothetical protein [Deltaproteobacteria bacterium]